MRFLLFNIAVIAALVYLFSMERGDFHRLADGIYDGLDKAQGMAEEAAGRAPEKPNAAKPATKAEGSPKPAPVKTAVDGADAEEKPETAPAPKALADDPMIAQDLAPVDAAGSEDWAKLLAELEAEQEILADESQDAQTKAQETQIAKAQPDLEDLRPPPGVPDLTKGLLPVKDPAVARRRAEVLQGLDMPLPPASPAASTPSAPATTTTATVQLAEGEALMSNEERLKQLYVLAEEMELFFVQKLAK